MLLRMGDTLSRRPVKGRLSHSRGARPLEASARPPFSSSAEVENGEKASGPGPRRGRAWRAANGGADSATLRRLARLLLHRGERFSREGDFLEAAFHFEGAATISEGVGNPIPAAEAALELGRCALVCGHTELLASLAGRIDNLASEHSASLPIGGFVGLRVWAQILRKAESKPVQLCQLIQDRRRERRGANRLVSRPAGEPDGIDGGLLAGLFRSAQATAGGAPPIDADWTLSEDGGWFVRVIEDGPAAARIECGQRIVDLAGRLGCPVRRQIEVRRVVVKVAADRRGRALMYVLQEESRGLEQEPS